MSLANLKVGARLGLGFGAVLALMIVLAVLGLSRMAQIQDKLDDIVDNDMAKMLHVYAMRTDVNISAIAVRNVVLFTNQEEVAAEAQRIDKSREDYLEHAKKLTAMVTSEAGKAILVKIEEGRTTTTPLVDKVIQLGRAHKNVEATQVLIKEVRPSQRKWLDSMAEMLAFQEKKAADSVEAAHSAYASARMLVISLALTALALGALIAWFIARSITRPLQQAVTVASAVAEGDLTRKIEVQSKDETGLLLSALKHMNENLSNIVGNVRNSTDSIAAAAKQIAAGNSDLSQRTEEQASSLEETASSMEELTSTVKQNAENAKQANQLAIGASDTAIKGGEVVGQVVHTMNDITESSRKIVDIISVIDGIAFQTNILALNAAVEAARAGEQGRGFAVVATEVRNLAQRSAAAAKEIKSLINDSVEKVGNGSVLVGEAGKTMEEIVTAVKRVTDIMGEITAASQEQSSGIEQVNQAITQMDEVTQQNAALVEEAAAAATSMEEQAQNLTTAVAVFQLASAQQAGGAMGGLAEKPAPAPAERRGGNRAKNVSRLAAAKKAETGSAADQPRAKTGTDDEWNEF